MIGIWTDQCGPACLPRSAWSTSNPQFTLHYHDELDAVMTVPADVNPGPHTIIAAGQTQAPGFGCTIMTRITKNLDMHEGRGSTEQQKLQPVYSRRMAAHGLCSKGVGQETQ